MPVETQFYFLDRIRSSYLWASPNEAGAFLACLLPVLWWLNVDAGRRARWLALLAVEGLLLWLILRTYSRGSVCSVAVALVYTAALRSPEWRIRFRWLATRAAVFAPLFLVSGIWQRVAAAAGDAAVTNRWALYRSGLQMVADTPLGWGAGESGLAFSNWYQAANVDVRYLGMVSTILEVGVERGVWVLAGLLAVVAFSAMMPFLWRGNVPLPAWRGIAAAGGVVVTWFVNACFSTITESPSLWLPFAAGIAASLALLRLAIRSSPADSRRFIFAPLLTGAALTACFFAVGWAASLKRGLKIERGDARAQILKSALSTAPAMIAFLPDPEILGDTWGKELRIQLRESRYPSLHATVSDPRVSPPTRLAGSSPLFLFGTFCSLAATDAAPLALVCPASPPPSIPLPAVKVVCLPQWDELGHNDAWKTWARIHRVPVIEATGCGQDVRAAWPAVFDRLVEQVCASAEAL